jgi:hypothetical protein
VASGYSPAAGTDFESGFVRNLTTGNLVCDVGGGAVTLNTSDIEIGAVELKDGTTNQRALIDTNGAVATNPGGQVADGGARPGLIYVVGGYDGANVRSLKTDATGILKVDVAGQDVTLKNEVVDSSTGAQVLAAAPGSDSGQRALAVRVVSQLGAGAASGGLAQTQVRNSSNVWTDVGYSAGDQRVPVDGSGVTQPVSAASLPLPAGAAQEHTTAISPSAARLTDGTTFYKPTTPSDTQPVSALSLPLPAGAATETTLGNVAKDATLTGGNQKAILRGGAKGSTAAADLTSSPVDANTQALHTSVTNFPATQAVSQATAANLNATVAQQTLTKGTQGATGVSTQDLKDAGRNGTHYHMTIPVVTTSSDALVSLTGYKGGAAVAATTTPAVVTAAKTYRITAVTITYVAIATAGSVKFTLRANTGGVVALGSPAVCAWVVGGPSATAGVAQTVDIAIPDGMEFAAGTGVGVSMIGLSATQVAAAVGYGQIVINGFEY